MHFDFEKMQAADRYELLLSTVVPRPIALITTLGKDGTLNAAPYSLFNVIGHDPPPRLYLPLELAPAAPI
jgi:flavin reductase (DIM6/NTAB) family NADH-FMN oxidoreductase RutF